LIASRSSSIRDPSFTLNASTGHDICNPFKSSGAFSANAAFWFASVVLAT
jgi:hypothetical protein